MLFLISPVGIVGIVIGGVIGLFVLFVICWGIAKANYFKRMQVKIRESQSNIEIALNKRFDLLTKQLDVCKGYVKHENETLVNVTLARTTSKTNDINSLSKLNDDLSKISTNILAAVESYPQLKADALFSGLQSSINEVEEHLLAARRIYNSNVTIYNQEIVTYPSSIIANMIHCTAFDFFKVEEKKAQDVSMKFD